MQTSRAVSWEHFGLQRGGWVVNSEWELAVRQWKWAWQVLETVIVTRDWSGQRRELVLGSYKIESLHSVEDSKGAGLNDRGDWMVGLRSTAQ